MSMHVGGQSGVNEPSETSPTREAGRLNETALSEKLSPSSSTATPARAAKAKGPADISPELSTNIDAVALSSLAQAINKNHELF